MKTAKELESLVIAQRFNGGTSFHKFASNLIYKGITTFDWLQKTYGIPSGFKGTQAECDTLGLNYNELAEFISNDRKYVNRRVESRYEKHRVILNDFLSKENSRFIGCDIVNQRGYTSL